MTKQLLTTLASALYLASGCTNAEPLAPASSNRPLFSQVPADGNGNKLVIPIDAQFTDFVTCNDGATLDLHVVGWVQVRMFSQPNNRHVELDGVYVVFTYSNAAGQTFVWRELGPDHFYIDGNGNLVHAVTGHDGFDGVIGRIVTNAATGEVLFVAGNQSGTRDDRACVALT